jgi:hypothetical protein
MPRVDWTLLCDLAYFDAYRSLCVIGVQTQSVPSFAVGTRRFAIAARVAGLPPHPKVTVSLSAPPDAVTPATCERVQVEAVGDHLVLTIGVAPLIDNGVYRFEVALLSPPSAVIDLPIVIGDPETHLRPLWDGQPVNLRGAVLPLRGINHVGLG